MSRQGCEGETAVEADAKFYIKLLLESGSIKESRVKLEFIKTVKHVYLERNHLKHNFSIMCYHICQKLYKFTS